MIYVLICFTWLTTVLFAYYLGLRKTDEILEGYRDAVVNWGKTLDAYKELHGMYKKLLKEFKEKTKIHIN